MDFSGLYGSIFSSKYMEYYSKPVDIYDLLKNSAGNYDIDDYNAVLTLD